MLLDGVHGRAGVQVLWAVMGSAECEFKTLIVNRGERARDQILYLVIQTCQVRRLLLKETMA